MILLAGQALPASAMLVVDPARTGINMGEHVVEMKRWKDKIQLYKSKYDRITKMMGMETDAENNQGANKVLRKTQVLTDVHNKAVSSEQQAAPGACQHVDSSVKAGEARDEADCFRSGVFRSSNDVAGLMYGTLDRQNVNLNLDYIMGRSSSGGAGTASGGASSARPGAAAAEARKRPEDEVRSQLVRKMLSYSLATGAVQPSDAAWVTAADRARNAQSTKESIANGQLLLTDPGLFMAPDRFLTYTQEQALSARQAAFIVTNPKMMKVDSRRGDDVTADVARVGSLRNVLVADVAYKTMLHVASLRVQPGAGKPSYLDAISYYSESAFENGPSLRRLSGTEPDVSLEALQRDAAAFDAYRAHMAVTQFREALNQELVLAVRLAERLNRGR